MKHFNRIPAALLAALMLCGAWTAVAEMDVDLEIEAQGNPEGVDPETGDNEPEVELELDDGLQLDGVDMPTLDTEIDMEGDLLIDEAEAQVDESVQPNDSDSDFVIKNGVLIDYWGDGGDVVIPDGVTVIGNKAFSHCERLTSIIIPSSVTRIQDGMSIGTSWSEADDLGAFSSCTNLVSVTIYNGLTRIGDNAFYHCPKLKKVTLPGSVTSIGWYAFYECEDLTDIVIPKGVKTIGGWAFRECEKLTNIILPNSVTGIGECAFRDCKQLDSVIIPDSIKKWGDQAFFGCTNLIKLTLSDGVTSIGEDAFYGCKKLTNVTIPNSVTQIETDAFSCSGLTSVIIPSSVNDIGPGAFACCDRLKKVTILAKDIYIYNASYYWGYDADGSDSFYKSNPTFYIIESSDAIEWAEDEEYDYVIISNALSDKFIKLKSGYSHRLSVLGEKDGKISWYSSDKSVATVDNGKVTGKKVGKCVISATLESGKTLKCNVAVYDPAEINATTLTLNLEENYKLTVTDLMNRKVTWASSNTAIASVKNGKIKPRKAGKCTITATLSKEKYLEKKTLTCRLTVTDSAKLSADKLNMSSVDSATIKLTGALKRKVTWSTSNSGVVKITNSNSDAVDIKAVKLGTATITAKIEDGKTLKCVVTVVNPLTITVDEIVEESVYNKLWVYFNNYSNKKITYVTLDIAQYNNRGDKLKSPYDYYYLNENVWPHDDLHHYYWVNDDTKKVKIRITEVTFADKTTWRP